MRQISLLVLIGTLTALVGGCQFLPDGLFGGGDTTEEPTVESVPIPNDPAAEGEDATEGTEAAEGETAAEGENFEDPVVAEESDSLVTPPTDGELITSTNSDERVQQINQDRGNPFALIPVSPRIVPDEDGNTNNNQNTEEPAPPDPGGLADIPELVPLEPSEPPPPPTDLARAMIVTGVVQIGSTPHAIIAAPNEPHSRYVREGQFVSNGQVLVKRIEMRPGVEPRVVFEQNGIEIVRAVGEGSLPEATTAANTALPAVPLDSSI